MARRRTTLGSPPALHAKRLRREIIAIYAEAEHTIKAAQRGDCLAAAEAYAETRYHYGAAHTHMDSTSSKTPSGRSPHFNRLPLNLHARKVIAARKALEACLTRKG
jgi:hypothetical protein